MLFDWMLEGAYVKVLLVFGSSLVLFCMVSIFVGRWALIFLQPYLQKLGFGPLAVQWRASRAIRFIQSPAAFAIIYLALIPTFAGIYASLPENSLYSSTRKLDQHFYQDGYNYREVFNELLRQRLKPVPQRMNIGIGSLSSQGIAEYGQNFFDVEYQFRGQGACGINCANLVWNIYVRRFGQDEEPAVGPNSSIPIEAYISETKCLEKSCPKVESIFLGPWKSVANNGLLPFVETVMRTNLYMNRDQFEIYQDMSNAYSGNALGNYGRLSRAMYFSATVVTTLGFGDILPISDAARTAIMMEAIAGVLVIGFFFNALASQIANRRN